MEKPLTDIYQALQKLIGLHRQLLETVRAERDALVNADKKAIQETTCAKQALIEAVRNCELERLNHMTTLAMLWRRPLRELTVSEVIIGIQGVDPKGAAQFQTTYNALTILIQRIKDQNEDNKSFVEKSLKHIFAMKQNILGESVPKSNTYTQSGQKSSPVGGARLISKEA